VFYAIIDWLYMVVDSKLSDKLVYLYVKSVLFSVSTLIE